MTAADGRSRAEQLQQTVYPSDAYTAVKHAVYRRYGQCWMAKVLQRFASASIVDAFCGAGEYSDGLDGSPMTIAHTFLEHSRRASFNQLEVVCLDSRPDRLQHLEGLIAKLPYVPKLSLRVSEAGTFDAQLGNLAQLAHAGTSDRPVLWLLDPYGWSDVPIDLAIRCINSGQRDEIIVSLFTEEMYRFASDANKRATFARVFGTDAWSDVVVAGDEAGTKDRLASLYRDQLRAAGFHVGKFAIAARGHMPRYHLIYATHLEKALAECWNPMTWYLDKYMGRAAGPADLSAQGDLFADADVSVAAFERLQQHLNSLTGQEVDFATLSSAATALGYTVPQLRAALTELRQTARAVRVDVLTQRSEWPDGSIVRFYTGTESDD